MPPSLVVNVIDGGVAMKKILCLQTFTSKGGGGLVLFMRGAMAQLPRSSLMGQPVVTVMDFCSQCQRLTRSFSKNALGYT